MGWRGGGGRRRYRNAPATSILLILLLWAGSSDSSVASAFVGRTRRTPPVRRRVALVDGGGPRGPRRAKAAAARPALLTSTNNDDDDEGGGGGGGEFSSSSEAAAAFDAAVAARYACTRFRRHGEQAAAAGDDGKKGEEGAPPRASVSDPSVVRQATHCLDVARRSPSGFNAQPYRVVLVSSPRAKEDLARWCLGRNADRVRDSDCTAVFLADREWGREWRKFGDFISKGGGGKRRSSGDKPDRPPPSKWESRYVRSLVLLFSSGLPLPRLLAAPISYFVRSAVALVGHIFGRRLLVPTLSSAETWSTKNTALVAMSYLLGCSSRGLDTCPMEGYWSPGVRGALGIPRRYAVPLIVSTGRAHRGTAIEGEKGEEEEDDDVGMSHSAPGEGSTSATPRYPLGEVVFGDTYGSPVSVLP